MPSGNSSGFVQHVQDENQGSRNWVKVLSQFNLSAVPGDVFRVHLQVYSIIS